MNITNSTIKDFGGENKELLGFDFSQTPKTPFRFDTFNLKPFYNVKAFGAKGDGATDDTTAIQSAIDYILNIGGGILYFPNGIYVVSGACQTVSSTGGTASNAQLTIRGVNYADAGCTTIKFLGETPPKMLRAGTGFTNQGTWPEAGGVVIKSTLTSNSTGYILGAETKSGSDFGFTYHDVYIESIAFKSGTDANGAIIGGVNGLRMHALNVKNCIAYANTNVFNSVLPTRNICGFNVGPYNCDWPNRIENCCAIGYMHGFKAGEHVTLDHCFAYGCLNAFTFGSGGYTVKMSQVGGFWCKYIINSDVSSSHPQSTIIADIVECERDVLGKWYSYANFVNDSDNYLFGSINYHVVTAYVGPDNPSFSKNGGTNLTCNPSY